jgi:hypothetical protein
MRRRSGANGLHTRSGGMLPPGSKVGREQEARHRVSQESRIGATLKVGAGPHPWEFVLYSEL